jgi:hypothetical protein
MAYDLFPLKTLEHKTEYLPTLADGRKMAVFTHDPDVSFATLQKNDERIEARPVAGE